VRNQTYVKLLLSCFALIALAGCGPAAVVEPTPVYTRVSDAALTAGEAVPVPEGDPILTLSGKIGTHNVDDTLQMDLATLESIGLIDYTVTDPFEDEEVTFQGVLMSALLDVAAVPADVTNMHMVALNDYSVDVPIADMRQYPIMLALKTNGAYMDVADRGPSMLVYPYDDFEFDRNLYNDYWIWQLRSIEFQ
jgi:hypothetical protein